MKYLIFILGFFFSLTLKAEGVGNGGFVTVCTENGKSVTKVLDYVEGEKRGFVMDLGSDSLSYELKVKFVFDRLRKIDSYRANKLQKWADEFMSELDEVGELGPLADTGSVGVPKNCGKPFPIIAQKGNKEIFPGDKRYLVILDKWKLLDSTAKAGLIIHEVIYRELIESENASSPKTRYFNSVISSRNLQALTKKEYLDVLKLAGFSLIELQGVLADIRFPIKVFKGAEVVDTDDPTTGVIAQVMAPIGSEIKIPGLEGAVVSGVRKNAGWINLAEVNFHPNGMVALVEYKRSRRWKNSKLDFVSKPSNTIMLTQEGYPNFIEGNGRILLNGQWVRTEKAWFRANGHISRAHFIDPVEVDVWGAKRAVTMIAYYANGNVMGADLVVPVTAKVQDKSVLVDEVYFSSSGVIWGYVLAQPLEKLDAPFGVRKTYDQVDELGFDESGSITTVATPDTCYYRTDSGPAYVTADARKGVDYDGKRQHCIHSKGYLSVIPGT
jgi:hypothetical protein